MGMAVIGPLDGVAVDELDVAELCAGTAALDEAHPDEPSIDQSC
jgi:hypothetical protein